MKYEFEETVFHPENHRCLQDDFDGREDCPQCTEEEHHDEKL